MCEDWTALVVEAPAEDELPEPDMVREPPPIVLTTVTPAALTVVTTEPADKVLTTVTPAAFVVVTTAPALKEEGADDEPAEMLLGAAEDDPWAGFEVTLEGDPGADELPSVAALGLELESELEEPGFSGTGVTIGPNP